MVRRKGVARRNGSPTRKSSTHVFVNRSTGKRRGLRILNEIKYLRNSVKLLIPAAPFARLVREIIYKFFPRDLVLRIQASALKALQESTEAYIVQFFEDCLLLTYHAKRKTITVHDMLLLRRLKGRDDIINR